MNILVSDGRQGGVGALQIKIKDLSSGLEAITVHGARSGTAGSAGVASRSRHQIAVARAAIETKIKEVDWQQLRARLVHYCRVLMRVLLKLLAAVWAQLLPLIKLAKRKFLGLSRNKRIAVVAACTAVVIFLGIQHPSGNNGANTDNAAGTSTVRKPPKLTKGTPNYATILPAGKNIQELGGWTRVSPPGKDPVYTYIDKISNVQVDVSEQPLPKNFQTDTDAQISQLAQGFNASDKFSAGNTAVYVGTAANGQQSVILTKNKLLVLIKSAATLTNDQWVAYISSLQ